MKKKLILIVSLILCIVTMTAIFCGCNAIKKAEEWIDGIVAFDGDGKEMIAGESYDMPDSLVFTKIYGSGASSPLTINATFDKSVVAFPELDWAVAWNNPNSTWASGKTVTDYVTITPTSDGAQSAALACLAPFGERVDLSVTLRADRSVNASCSVGYYVRLDTSGFGYSFGTIGNTTAYSGTGTSSAPKSNIPVIDYSGCSFNAYSSQSGVNNKIVINPAYGVGCVTPALALDHLQITASNGLYSALQAQSIATASQVANIYDAGNGELFLGDVYRLLSTGSYYTGDNAMDPPYNDIKASVDKFNAAIVNNSDSYDFKLTAYYTGSVDNVSVDFYFRFDRYSSGINASSINLSNASVIF